MRRETQVTAARRITEFDFLGTGTEWTHAEPGESGVVESVDDGVAYVWFERSQTTAEVPVEWLVIAA